MKRDFDAVREWVNPYGQQYKTPVFGEVKTLPPIEWTGSLPTGHPAYYTVDHATKKLVKCSPAHATLITTE